MVDQIFSMVFREVVGFWSLFCHDFLDAVVYFDEPIAFWKVGLARKNLQSSLWSVEVVKVPNQESEVVFSNWIVKSLILSTVKLCLLGEEGSMDNDREAQLLLFDFRWM